MFDYQNKIQFFVPGYPRLTFSLITYTYLKKKIRVQTIIIQKFETFQRFYL